MPLSDDDITYLDEMLRATNAMIAVQAAANDAEYVDTYDESVGHDVCTAPGTRWFEGVVPTSPAFPIHPNALGEASMARSVLRVLGAARPVVVLSDLRSVRRRVTAGRAARFTYRLSQAGSVTLTLRRSCGRGGYSKTLRSATVSGRAGRCASGRRAGR